MSIVLLLSMMGGWDRWGVADSYQGVCGWGDRGWVLSHSLFLFLFVLLSFGLSYPLSFLSE